MTSVIDVHHLSRRFPGPVPVEGLKDVSLVVEPGEYLAICGASGSGKSTLLNILGLLDRPTSGSYLLDGQDVTGLSEKELNVRRALDIGMVFQAFHLMDDRSVEENVGLGLMYSRTPIEQRAARTHDVLAMVGLTHRASFDARLLSGGERQRVAIARALISRPTLLLADEPTGNLDSVTSSRILALFESLRAAGQTVVMITHDAAVADEADTTVWMRDGVLTRKH